MAKTVGELIKQLQELDPNLPVYVDRGQSGYRVTELYMPHPDIARASRGQYNEKGKECVVL